MKSKKLLKELSQQIGQIVKSQDKEEALKFLTALDTRLQKEITSPAVQRRAAHALPTDLYPNSHLMPAMPAVYFQDGIDIDDVWDETLQNLRPPTSAEQETIIAARIKRFQVQQKLENKAATSHEPILADEIDRDRIWDEDLQTACPATRDEQTKIDYTRRRQSMFQGKMKNKVSSS